MSLSYRSNSLKILRYLHYTTLATCLVAPRDLHQQQLVYTFATQTVITVIEVALAKPPPYISSIAHNEDFSSSEGLRASSNRLLLSTGGRNHKPRERLTCHGLPLRTRDYISKRF